MKTFLALFELVFVFTNVKFSAPGNYLVNCIDLILVIIIVVKLTHLLLKNDLNILHQSTVNLQKILFFTALNLL